MRIIKLEDGMNVTILPLPFDVYNFSYLYRGIYTNKYIYSTNSEIDKQIILKIWEINNIGVHRCVSNLFFKYFSYALYCDELVLISYGRKIYEILELNSPLLNDNFQFKKLKVNIELVDSQIGRLNNFDNSYLTHEYYNIKFNNLDEYINSLSISDKFFIQDFLKNNSFTSEHNKKHMMDFFEKNKMGDFNLFIENQKLIDRRNKILKIKNKCLN